MVNSAVRAGLSMPVNCSGVSDLNWLVSRARSCALDKALSCDVPKTARSALSKTATCVVARPRILAVLIEPTCPALSASTWPVPKACNCAAFMARRLLPVKTATSPLSITAN